MIVSGGHSAWAGFAALVMGSLSVYGLLTFLFFAGIAGLLLATTPVVPRVGIALVVGAVAALACGAMMERLMSDTSGHVTHENSRLEGREVKITRAIRPARTGEATFTLYSGVYQNIPVRSLDGGAIRAGQIAVVVEVRRGIAWVAPIGYAASGTDPDDAEEPPSSPTPAPP